MSESKTIVYLVVIEEWTNGFEPRIFRTHSIHSSHEDSQKVASKLPEELEGQWVEEIFIYKYTMGNLIPCWELASYDNPDTDTKLRVSSLK